MFEYDYDPLSLLRTFELEDKHALSPWYQHYADAINIRELEILQSRPALDKGENEDVR